MGKSLADQMEELKEKMRQMKSKEGLLLRRRSPFSQTVIEEPLPPGFRQARVGEYDGSSDP